MKGNVVFASALFGWGFTVPSLARALFRSKILPLKPMVLRQCLFGDFKYKNDKVLVWKADSGDEVPLFALAGSSTLPDILIAADLAPSKREARRLIQQGAVSIDGERVSDPAIELAAREEPYLFKVGKRRFARVRVE